MKITILLLVSALLLTAPLKVIAQVASGASFTRVQAGAIATDVAHSFGCAWGDYNKDGYLDLVVGNGFGDANALYSNNGDKTFTRILTNAIATTIGDTGGVAWGDYNNDGHLDLFLANWVIDSFLFRNNGDGDFTRVTGAEIPLGAAPFNGCTWGDYDSDGFLDLLIANSGNVNRDEHLYRNNGDGTFTRIVEGPVVTSAAWSGSPQWIDYDNDGRLDLSVSPVGYLVDSLMLLFHNEGSGAFSLVTNLPTQGNGEGGTEWGDYDNDGDLDLIGAGREGGPEAEALVFRNDGNGEFTRIAIAGVDLAVGLYIVDATLGDYDNDGWLDVMFRTRTEPGAANVNSPRLLFRNNGDGTFTRVIGSSLVNDLAISVGMAWADYDNDGFLDLYVANGFDALQANFLYHNDGNSNHWLSVECKGTDSNRSGVGAKVRVKASIGGVERWQLREISSGNGYNGSGMRAHFGLGDATNAALVRIEWPSGTVQELTNVAANQIFHVTEPPRIHWNAPNTISWSRSADAFQLESGGQPDGPWTNATEMVVVQGNRKTVSLQTNEPAKFYRLRKPTLINP